VSSKDALLAEEDRGWHALCARFARMPEDEFAKPGANGEWTPKDMMAHVAAWHAQTVDRFECLRTTGDLPDVPDVDTFNERTYQECKDMPLHDVRAMFESSRHRFREEIAMLPAEPTERVRMIVAANGHDHYDEHIPQLEAFLGSSR